MTDVQIQPIFQLCSYLLNYPDEAFVESLDEVKAELDTTPFPEIQHELEQFCLKAKNQSLPSLVSTYITTFDFGKKTNLYVSYMAGGEQRERGMDLLFLKNYYKMHGFHVTDKELPDYLPIVLEFASQVEVAEMEPVFTRYMKSIAEIAGHLNPNDNLYGHIFQAILQTLERTGIRAMNSEVFHYV
ncbi:nitrate reductase molybdenum cofactor assembly chaperone [Bacillus benzoevorans]